MEVIFFTVEGVNSTFLSLREYLVTNSFTSFHVFVCSLTGIQNLFTAFILYIPIEIFSTSIISVDLHDYIL